MNPDTTETQWAGIYEFINTLFAVKKKFNDKNLVIGLCKPSLNFFFDLLQYIKEGKVIIICLHDI